MDQLANISQAIKAIWLGNTALTTLVPGGILYGIIEAGTPRPFASMIIELYGEPEYQTGVIYVQQYRLIIGVYSNAQLGNAGAIQTALESLLGCTTKLAGLTSNAWTLEIDREPSDVEEMIDRFEGQFTFVAGATWIIQLQQNRGA